MYSFDFYHFILKSNTLAMFSRIILKKEKNGFSSKNMRVLRLFWNFFDINVAHLKMVYRCLEVTHMNSNCKNNFILSPKNIFLKIQDNSTNVAPFSKEHCFAKMEIFWQIMSSKTYHIFFCKMSLQHYFSIFCFLNV